MKYDKVVLLGHGLSGRANGYCYGNGSGAKSTGDQAMRCVTGQALACGGGSAIAGGDHNYCYPGDGDTTTTKPSIIQCGTGTATNSCGAGDYYHSTNDSPTCLEGTGAT